jgi:ABC-2 type transport system ATP-binding protein
LPGQRLARWPDPEEVTDPIIETNGLTKRFGDVTAVDNVSLSVAAGEIYGFLGLNGAGKTTTIRMLLGMIKPSSGSARILGMSINRGGRGPWAQVGCLVEVPYAYPDLTVRENLEMFRRLRGLDDPAAVDRIIDKLKLGPYAGRKAGHLSLGNAQRLGIAKALMHQPLILILDEPSNGLDPAGIVETRELLLDLCRNHRVTIFISSHILGEIAKLADRIGIIHQGRLLQEVNSTQLDTLRRKRLLVRTRDNTAALKVLAARQLDARMAHSEEIQITSPAALSRPEDIATLLVNSSLPPVSLYLDEEELEAYFLRVIHHAGESA